MIFYLCDLKACENCRSNASDCIYTSDIKHAVNFKKNNFGDYEEQPALLEAKDSFTDLVKELNTLLEHYREIRIIKFPFHEDFNEQRKRIDDICKTLENAINAISKKIENECLPIIKTVSEVQNA